ncbi:retrotransposon protein, putative, ty1-copia subclass [Tanacetum coccineum]
MLAPSGEGLILYQAYGNLYAMTGRKAHFPKDKQILSVGVFDEVFSTWMTFGGNTSDLCLFGEETTRLRTCTKIHQEELFSERGDGVASIKRRRRDLSGDGVWILAMASQFEDKLDYLEQPIPSAPVPAQAGVKNSVCSTSRAVASLDCERLSLLQTERRAVCKLLRSKNEELYRQSGVPSPPRVSLPWSHWKRNCPQYLAELLKNKKLSQGASGSGIFTIELYTFPNKSWVYDTGCGTHICNTTQGLKGSRKLNPGALSLYVGNGQRAAVEAIGSYHLFSRLYDDGYVNLFVDNTISVSRNNMVYFSAIPRDGIFEIDLSNSNTNDSSVYAVSNKKAKLNLDSALLWHCRLGHISKKRIEKLQHDGLLNSTDLRAFEKCVSCMSRKMARKPYTHQVERAKDQLGLIHTDVYGPFRTVSRQGASYFVTFTDDFSRYGYVYLLKHKHEVFETFKVFQKDVENQLEKTIKSLRSDRGGEYMKRRIRTLLDIVCSMMSQTTLPKSFWDYALETAARILNMVPTKKGCEALVNQDTLTKPEKLEPRFIKCIFVGYPKETMGYSFYYPPENKVLVAWNAEFLENSLITQEASGSLEDHEIIQEEDTHPSIDTNLNHEENDLEIDEPQSDIIPIRRSTRTLNASNRMCLYIDAEEHKLGDLGEPANYKDTLLDHESDKWLNAMNVDMQSMKDNKVWDLVDLPPNGKTIGSKWLLKKKTEMDGAVHTFKACLVAKGFTQTYGVDYKETISPVAEIKAIRILKAIAAYYDYEIWQMDKASRQWNKRFDDEIKKFGFTQNHDEPCVYLKASGSNVTFLGASTPAKLKRMQNMPYASAVGSIMYAVRCDIKRELKVSCYIDAGYLTDADDLKKFISGLGVVLTIEEPINMYCDNTKAITIANESGITKGARHFRAKVHYLCEVIEYGDIKLEKVHTYDNLADSFTKALAFLKHSEHSRNIGMLPASSLM